MNKNDVFFDLNNSQDWVIKQTDDDIILELDGLK